MELVDGEMKLAPSPETFYGKMSKNANGHGQRSVGFWRLFCSSLHSTL